MLTPTARFASLALLALIASCDVEEKKKPCSPCGTPYNVWEREPNDQACCPDDLGWIAVGDDFVIGGTIRDDPADPFDGFLLRANSPCSITFRLDPLDGASDLDLCVWDPVAGRFSFCFESSGTFETGVFNVLSSGAAFHLVVGSYVGQTEYRLRVRCDPIALGLDDGSMGDTPQGAPGPREEGRFAPYAPKAQVASAPEAAARLRHLWLLQLDLASGEFAVLELGWRLEERTRDAGRVREEADSSAVQGAP